MPLRILCCLLAATWLPAATMIMWDGTTQEGEVGYQRTTWLLSQDGDTRRIDAREICSVRFASQGTEATADLARVTLRGGSHLVGTIHAAPRLQAIPLERLGEISELPIASVASVEFGLLDPGASPTEPPEPPYVIMRNGRVVPAEPEWLTWMELGVVTPAGRLRLARDQINRLVLAPTRTSQPDTLQVRLSTIFGDAVDGRLMSLDTDWAELRVDGLTVRFPTERLLRIDASDQRLQSLLSLEPDTIKTTPYLSLVRQPAFDSGLFGGPVLAQGIRFEHGIAAHSHTVIAYRLGGGYRRLLCQVGLDTRLTDRGDAVLLVRGDGKQLARVPLDGDSGLAALNVSLEAVDRLELVVDYGSGGSTGDHAVWADPRLIAAD